VNLSSLEAREQLIRDSEGNEPIYSLVKRYINDYIRLFPTQDFLTVYSGGLIGIQGKNNQQFGANLKSMLEITGKLVRLEEFPGFDSLLEGFRNPTQFSSTIFETNIASWCASRKICQSIEFSPAIAVADKVKHPEFLWRTTLGNIYCECKQENSLNNSVKRRIQKLFNDIGVLYEKNSPWNEDYRLDIIIEHPARDGTSQILGRLIQRTALLQQTGKACETIVEGVVTIKIVKKGEPTPDVRGCIQIHRQIIGSAKAEQIIGSNALYTLTMSVMKHRLKQFTDLIRDARTQMPKDGQGAIFIDIGGSKLFEEKLHQLLSNPEYANTPWISTWEGDQIKIAVYRRGQPLDHRLLE
jgi:hypothetical protein